MHMVDARVVIVDRAQHVAAGKGQVAGIEQQRNALRPNAFMKASSSGSVSTTAAMWWW